jgi:ABC-2 type transport system ATP-binding protein
MQPYPNRRPDLGLVELQNVTKTFPGQERSLRGTKLQVQGPALWLRQIARSARLTSSPAEAVTALRGVSIAIEPGEVFGLIGRNGSGKTTLVKILAGLLRPTSGRGAVDGIPLGRMQAIRRRVSYVSTTGWMGREWPLTAEENVRLFGVLCGLSGREARQRTDEALEVVGLADARTKYPSQLSNGMRQRCILARAFLFSTPLVLLDEPTVGLDPLSARAVLGLIRERMTARGQTVLLTDHISAEMEAVADRVAILEGGRIVQSGTPSELKAALAELTVLEVHTEAAPPPLLPPPAIVRTIHRTERPGPVPTQVWRIHALKTPRVVREVLSWIASPSRVVFVAESEPTLEDAVRLTLSEHVGASVAMDA